MPITNLEETSAKATTLLREAIYYERHKKWMMAIKTYKRLVALVHPDTLPLGFSYPDTYRIMMYEIYANLGWVYQHIDDYELALRSYTKALDIIYGKKKSGGLTGCRSPTCLAVPVQCKRALAHSSLQNYNAALEDVTNAQKMDEKNLDLLCLEVLIHNTFGQYDKAMKLLATGLTMNKAHDACLFLRSSLKLEGMSPKPGESNVEGFDEVTTLRHHDVINFIERHLHTITVPHTMDFVSLPSHVASKSDLNSSTGNGSKFCQSYSKSFHTAPFDMKWKRAKLSEIHPFKCGALPSLFERDPAKEEYVHADKHRRREQYSGSLKEHTQKMKLLSQEEFMNMLEKSNSMKRLSEWKIKQDVGVAQDTVTIAAFQPINTKNVPRLYNRPWQGDRLQSAPLPTREKKPIFYPAYS